MSTQMIDVHLQWKVPIIISRTGPLFAAIKPENEARLFNVRTGNSFIRSIGGNLKTDYSPITLEPTSVFHDAIRRALNQPGVVGKKFPYRISDANSELSLEVFFSLRLYASRIVVLTIRANTLSCSSVDDVSLLQDLNSYPELARLTEVTVELILFGRKRHGENLGSRTSKAYPCVLLFTGGQSVSKKSAVQILTRHPSVNDGIVNHVVDKNRAHQVDDNLFLLDKQGALCLVFDNENNRAVKRRYESICALLEYAIATDMILTAGTFKTLSCVQRQSIKRLIQAPRLLLAASVTAQRTWECLVDEFQLKGRLTLSQQIPRPRLEKWSWKATIFAAFLAVISIVWGIFTYLYPKEKVEPSTEAQRIQGSGNMVIQGSNNTIVAPPASPPTDNRKSVGGK